MSKTESNVSNVWLNRKNCCFCQGKLIKHGITSSGKSRFKCLGCRKTRVEYYSYNAYKSDTDKNIVTLTKEGLGIRSTARVLKISTTTLLKRIIIIAESINKPIIPKGKEYEVDEMYTYIGKKKNAIWLVYALEKESKRVMSFTIGKRTNKTLSRVLDILKLSHARKIFTDRLRNYRYLIEKEFHSVRRYGTNHIERNNLTLRTHLKRLNRRTICFSKSLIILNSILKIYFWL
jgi:insertion element IS1 protein InsB